MKMLRFASLVVLLMLALPAAAVQRFPPPEFESGHVLPTLRQPAARAALLEYLDVAVLAGALLLAAWLVLRARSRRGVVALSLFSLLYFGFWRKGCVCAIGSIQNVAQALCDPSYSAPLPVLAFAFLPLICALLFGRVFCAAVCPHGAAQDLLLLKAVRVPRWLDHGLRLLAYAYLGLAVVFAASGSGYIICQYDPFVPIFRLSGHAGMVLLGVGFLLAGTFIGRPYCRYLCPYGVLLGLCASVSRAWVRITPDTCTSCRLCEQSCPFGAINPSTVPESARATVPPRARPGRWALALTALLVLGVGLGGGAGSALARHNARVALAERVQLEDSHAVPDISDASAAFRGTGTPVAQLYAEARAIEARHVTAGRWLGAWLVVAAGAKLLLLAGARRRTDYEADRSGCVACARCYRDCPQEQVRLGLITPVRAEAQR